MSERVDASQLMPLAAMLGVQTVEATAEQVRLRLPWSAEVCTSGGVMHGGATMALSDTEVRDSGGRLVARTPQAQLVLSPRDPKAL
jgi:uncharacterized protein (TIGR00369 family)